MNWPSSLIKGLPPSSSNFGSLTPKRDINSIPLKTSYLVHVGPDVKPFDQSCPGCHCLVTSQHAEGCGLPCSVNSQETKTFIHRDTKT